MNKINYLFIIWCTLVIYVFISVVLDDRYVRNNPPVMTPRAVILDPSCDGMDKGQIIIEQGFNIQIVRCIPL
jgi:hypothetical protein